MQMWLVRMNRRSNAYVICSASGREHAKGIALKRFYTGSLDNPTASALPDNYVVTPLTMPGDRVHLDITVSTE